MTMPYPESRSRPTAWISSAVCVIAFRICALVYPGLTDLINAAIAAAPHAAAIAALIKSVRPGYTNAQILNAMTQTALDIHAVGLDRDSGYGIVMALAAANYALT